VRGVPVVPTELPEPDPEDITSPFDLPLQLSRRDAEAVSRTGMEPDAPIGRIELSALFRAAFKNAYKKIRKEMDDSAEAQRRELAQILDRAPRDVAEQIGERLDRIEARLAPLESRAAGLERDFDPLRRIARWAAGGALAAVIAIVTLVYQRGQAEQLTTDRLGQLERAVERLEDRLNHDRDHTSQQGPRP